MPGKNAKEIDISVTYTVPVGWVTTGDVVIMCCPTGGGDIAYSTKEIEKNKVGKITVTYTRTNLVSDQTYDVHVHILVKDGMNFVKRVGPGNGQTKAK